MGGCAAGAALSAKGGPQAMALGCAGFAAFSSICFGFFFVLFFFLCFARNVQGSHSIFYLFFY